jgi:hypothetical protein
VAGLSYDLLGQRSPFWLGIALLIAVITLIAGGLPSSGENTRNNPV